MNNVKKGDLAIVVRRSKDNPHTHGLVVRVLRRQKPCKWLKGTKWYVSWHIAAASGRKILVGNEARFTATCPDFALRRINENDRKAQEVAASPVLECV
jgi:hypothetical protein